MTRFLGSEEVLREVLEMALGRRGFTHERTQHIDSIMFPRLLKINGKPLDFQENPKWGKQGWEGKTERGSTHSKEEGVGGIAGIWHSNKAGWFCEHRLLLYF